MVEDSELFIGLHVSKDSHAVAVAEGGRGGEVRWYGEIGADAGSVRRLVRKLCRPGLCLGFCSEVGPTGYGLKRLIEEMGHACAVIRADRYHSYPFLSLSDDLFVFACPAT